MANNTDYCSVAECLTSNRFLFRCLFSFQDRYALSDDHRRS